MKIVCPHCSTNYQMDDSKVPEKGLPVKCSVCGNKFRVFREQGNEEKPELPKEEIAENQNASSDMDSLFDSMPANNNKDANDLDALLGGDFDNKNAEDGSQQEEKTNDDGGIEMASYHDEIGASQSSDADGVSFGGSGSSDLNLANDRFDDDGGLFSDDPHKEESNSNEDPLFADEPKSSSAGSDFDDLFSDQPIKNTADSAKKAEDDLFGDDANDGLFGDISDNKGENPGDNTDDFLKELFGDASSKPQESQKIYFRNKQTGRVIGPVDESDVDGLMVNGEITADDDISYDGVNWNGENSSFDAEPQRPSSGLSLGLGFEQPDDSMDSLLFEEGTAIHKEDNVEEEINFDDSADGSKVEHVYIPDEFSDTAAGVPVAEPKKDRKRGGSSVKFYVATLSATIIILAIIAGGAYYFYTKNNQGAANILDNISEQIAVNTGTLADVREALDKDTPEDYINSIGILKQYIKPDDSAPSAVGLDGQIKMNFLISYNKRIEASSSINDKISAAMRNAQGNIDLVKAKALYLYEQKEYDAAAELLQPFTDKNDQEVFYILGLIASGKNDLEKAENFFNTGFIQGGAKSVKIMYALANMKYQNGDTQSAMAFLNRIISETPNYMKAYLLKSKILMNSDNKLSEADRFLKNIDSNIIAKAEDFQKAEYYQTLASIASKRGNIKEAIGYYEKAVEINQTDTDAITKIADFYVQISDSTKAMEYYDMALKIDPKHAAAIIGKTEIYVLLGQKDKIYLELAKLDLKTLTNPQLLARVAKIYSSIGDKAKAIEFYDLSIKSDPSYIEPYIAKTQILLLDFNKVKELEQILIVLEQLGKDRYPYHLVKAIIDHKNADYKSASEHFKLAEEKNSGGDERVYFFYGEFLKDQQKYAEASKMLLRAHKVDPGNYDYMQSYIDSLEKEKKWQSVISMLEQKTFVEKKMYKSYVSMANSYFHLKSYEKALAAINKALELDSQKTSVYYLKAKILYYMGRYPEAEKEIDTAVVLDMKNFDNYMLYSKILSKQGDYKGAVEKIEAAEKIDPADQELLLMKGVVYKNLDDYRNALKYFNRVTDKSLKKEAYLEIGESYLQLNNRGKALDYLKKAEKSGNRGAAKLIAGIYYDSGDTNKAIIYYKKVLAYDKKDVESMSKLGYIYKEKGDLSTALRYFKRCMKYETDYNEKKMLEDEVYYIKQNMPQSSSPAPKAAKSNREERVEKVDSGDSEEAVEEAEDLYEEGMYIIDEDPEEAKRLFQEVMKTVSKNNEFYKKAVKALKKIETEQKKQQKKNEEEGEEEE
ncbi:zinc-ribbon domain-containing protein [bacterium]|nr:zinc-ribbon domain-containing protein [bacterium]